MALNQPGKYRILLAASAAVALMVGLAGHAAAAEQGNLNAVSFKAVPPGTAMAVRPWDDSDDNLALAEEFRTALRNRGYRVAEDAPIVLSFETRDILGAWEAGDRRSIIELEGHGGRTGGEDARAMLNLYESARGGVLNEGRPTQDVVNSKYQIDVTIDSKDAGRMWQAQATAELVRTDGLALTRKMVPGLVQAIGTTVKQGTLNLR